MKPDVASPAEGEETPSVAPSGSHRPFARSTFRFTHWIASLSGFDDRTFVLRVVQPALVVEAGAVDPARQQRVAGGGSGLDVAAHQSHSVRHGSD